MAYPNLKAEMARRGITGEAIATLLNLHSNTAYNKISGNSSFNVEEAVIIHDEKFPDLDMKYLFEKV